MMQMFTPAEGNASLAPWLIKMLASLLAIALFGWGTWSTREHYDARTALAAVQTDVQNMKGTEADHYASLQKSIDQLRVDVANQPSNHTLDRIEAKLDQINTSQGVLARRQQALEAAK
jgi:hypothetical protein